MKTHFKETIAELDAEILRVTRLRDHLVEIAGRDAATSPRPSPPRAERVTDRSVKRDPCREVVEFPPAKRAYKKRVVAGPVVSLKRNGVDGMEVVDVQVPVPHTAETMPEVPGTLGAAMKLQIGRLGKFTSDSLRQVIEAIYGDEDFVKNGQSFGVNLSYWSSKGKLEKLGTGPQASYRVVDKEFFERTEG